MRQKNGIQCGPTLSLPRESEGAVPRKGPTEFTKSHVYLSPANAFDNRRCRPPTPTRSMKFELLRGEASTKLNTSSTTGRHKSRLYLSPANVLCHRRKPKSQPEFGNRLHQHHTSTYPPPIQSAIDEGPNQHEFIRLPIPARISMSIKTSAMRA